ncbi:type I DNA topoisomerase, partial [Candidatus Saccharibacteria bacterium]|nr:type I DNA topoisomerase [Candidatus Saccharibacteria bacterium]
MSAKTLTNLMIVESPAKAKTIEKYLGPGWKVMSSVGHIRRISMDKNAVDVNKDFATIYEVDPEKKKVASELKRATKEAKNIWLATDADREGEAISWHLVQVLGLKDSANRVTFHEITKNAVSEAISKPRGIDMDLVASQQARQILDRLVGFELSPVVIKKVPGGRSAGRVQSPAVRLIVEREREIRDFESASEMQISGVFKKGAEFDAKVAEKFAEKAKVLEIFKQFVGAKFSVKNVDKVPGERKPGIPFTTSTLQQEASAKLGYSARTTMSAAQKLYQAGYITYMRTDAPTLSGQAIGMIGNYIKKEFGEEYHKVRNFKARSANAQEAHEAIRPTSIQKTMVSGSSYEQKIYELIWKRTVASQMAPAQIEKTKVGLKNDKNEIIFEAEGEIIVKDGFLRVYGGGKDLILPDLHVGDVVDAEKIMARQVFQRPPARYTEGSLVKELEKRGIGRPSTYATILDTIQQRGYVERGTSEGVEREIDEIVLEKGEITEQKVKEKSGATKGKLVPTPAGETLNDFLLKHFGNIVDYGFTAKTETELDEISNGDKNKTEMLHEFYGPFHKTIEDAAGIERASAQVHEIGVDPRTKLTIYARLGRFGPFVYEGTKEDGNLRQASIPRGTDMYSLSLEEALKLMELPRVVGKTKDGEEIMANEGRFGPYVKVGPLFVSIGQL